MKPIISYLLLAGAAFLGAVYPAALRAQVCQDEEAMVVESKKGLTELIDTTRKENLGEFERSYHQKTGVTKLGLTADVVDILLDCLDKASTDPAAPKDSADAARAKHESYSKFKDKLTADRKSLKAADDSKSAKALLSKFEYSD